MEAESHSQDFNIRWCFIHGENFDIDTVSSKVEML